MIRAIARSHHGYPQPEAVGGRRIRRTPTRAKTHNHHAMMAARAIAAV